MKLILENIGMLRRAEITLHKLCVIAGENDNGKSTLGKIVFCIVKAINRYKEDLQESNEFAFSEKVDEIYLSLRRHVPFANAEETIELIKGLRSPAKRITEIGDQLGVLDRVLTAITADERAKPVLKNELLNLRADIDEILSQPEDTNQAIEKAFNKVFASEFDSSLLLQGETQGRIQLLDGNLSLVNLGITRNGVHLIGDVEPIALKEATFIDSPLIFNNHDILARSQTLLDMEQRRSSRLGQPYTTLHTRDLFDKLRTPVLPFGLFDQETAQLFHEIHDIIDGKITYDRQMRDFIFQRRDEPISIKNTASGIKVFGLLQILIANEFVAKNTILIFDEPENHLHPKWQLKLAQILIKLINNGVYILVSSHSPYLIEALKRDTDRAELTHQARFALAQHQSITDEDRLGDIFEALAAPFEEFRKMDAEDLRDE